MITGMAGTRRQPRKKTTCPECGERYWQRQNGLPYKHYAVRDGWFRTKQVLCPGSIPPDKR